MKTRLLLLCAAILASLNAFGLGSDYRKGEVHASPAWPQGMDKLVNTTNRVHGFFVNAQDFLEIHFWTGGRIALDQVALPKNIEVRKVK